MISGVRWAANTPEIQNTGRFTEEMQLAIRSTFHVRFSCTTLNHSSHQFPSLSTINVQT